MTTVITVGECLIAFVADEPGPLSEAASFHRFVAGAEANVAVGLARLGYDVAYIGRIGADGFGETINRRLRGERVDTTHLRVDPTAPTAVMFRERRILGPAQVMYARSGSAGSRLEAADVQRAAEAGLFDTARWLHVTGITPALSADARQATEAAMRFGRAHGATVSLDLNLRRRLWSDSDAAPVLRDLARLADVVLGSPDELAVLDIHPLPGPVVRADGHGTEPGDQAPATQSDSSKADVDRADAAEVTNARDTPEVTNAGGTAEVTNAADAAADVAEPGDPAYLARAALALGAQIVVVKLGAAGCVAVAADDPDHAIAAPAFALATVVDPVGAGDAFCAGFIAARLDGVGLATALTMANACGAAAAATLGDQTGLPTRDELAALLFAGPTAPDTIR